MVYRDRRKQASTSAYTEEGDRASEGVDVRSCHEDGQDGLLADAAISGVREQ